MRITKRQLKRIIKEEKARLLREQQEMTSIFVLDDGETWAGEGYEVQVTPEQYDRIMEGELVYEVVPDWDKQDHDQLGINPGGGPPEAPMPDYMRGKTNDGEDY
jgi:hypothetical protein